MNHADLPSIRNATLPEKYEAAKAALKECERIDECKNWQDMAAAMASYAKQSADKTMENTAMRIRARAIQRCGELLREFEKVQGKHSKRGQRPRLESPRQKAAKDAGLKPQQAKDALRIANIPKASFEEQVESDNPPSIKDLAKQGTAKRHLTPREAFERTGMTQKVFQAGMHLRGDVRQFASSIQKYNLQDAIDGSTPKDREELRKNIATITKVLNQLSAKL